MQGLRGDRHADRAAGPDPGPGHAARRCPTAGGPPSVLRPAGGSSFGGDFLVSSCDGKTLEVALVDVAGKGVDAGTRALLLSGAFGGLLGSVPQGEFLARVQRLPAPRRRHRRLRHRDPPGARPGHRRLRGVLGRAPAAPPISTRAAGPGGSPRPGASSSAWSPDLRLRAGAGHAAARRRAHAVHRRAGRGAGPGHRRRHRPAARRGRPAGRVGFQDAAGELVRVVKAGGGAGSDDCALVMIWRT